MEKKDYILLPGIIAKLNDQNIGWRHLYGWQASQSDKLYSNSPYAYVAYHTAESLSNARRSQAAADPRAEFHRQFQRLNSQTERCQRRVVREWGEALENHPDISKKIVGWLKLDQEHASIPSPTRWGLRSQTSVETLPEAAPDAHSRQGSVEGPEATLGQATYEPPAPNVQQEPADDFAAQSSQAPEEDDVQETTPEQQLLEEANQAAERRALRKSSQAEPTQRLEETAETEAPVQPYEDSGGQQTQRPGGPQQVLTRARRALVERQAMEAAVRSGGHISEPIFVRRVAGMEPRDDYEGDSSRLDLVTHTVEKPSANASAAPRSDSRFPDVSRKVVIQHHVPSGTCCISGASPAAVRNLLPPHLYNALHREFLSPTDNTIVPSVELVFFGAEREVERCRVYVRVNRGAVKGLIKTLVDVDIDEEDGSRFVPIPNTKSRILLAPSFLITEPRRDRLSAAFGEELTDAVLRGPIVAAENEQDADLGVTQSVGFTTEPDAWTGGNLFCLLGLPKGMRFARSCLVGLLI